MKIHNTSDTEFRRIVAESYSIAEALKKMNLTIFGAAYRGFKIRCKELQVDTSHFTGQGHLKGKTHKWSKSQPLESILVENSNFVNSGSIKKKIIDANLVKYECSICGIAEWNNNFLVLQLDHINGINNDHRIENLRLLCPNCHSQTDTFCSKNKNKPKNNKIPKTKFKGDEVYIKSTCLECGVVLKEHAKKVCGPCYKVHRKKYNTYEHPTKINWPSLDVLMEMLSKSNYVQIGKQLGISDNAIRKHIKKLKESK